MSVPPRVAIFLLFTSLITIVGAVEVRADVPTPVVTAVPRDAAGTPGRHHPFFATDIVLSNYGYVEEEFFFDGTASTYTTPEFGRNAEVRASGIPFRSRLLVRRPVQSARFNGVVIVEWLNVTNGYDTDVLWLYQKEFFLREGYAWVGVSVQDGGVSRPPNGIKVWNPDRYGTINLTGGGTVTDPSLNFDVFSQAGAAVRRVSQVLGGLKPRYVIAAGQSQSAGRMGPYVNSVHSRDPIYDAAFLTVSNQPMRTDLTIPVIKVLSETERTTSRSQPDSAKVRVWTVAGSTHSEQYSLLSRAAFLMRDLNLPAVDACETPARSRVEIRYVYNAAIDALVKWMSRGIEPPHAPALQFDTPEPPATPAVKRDEHGNALGGIRLAEIAVPTAKESAELCGLGGTHVPFDTATLNRLYPTHAAYVSKVTTAARANVQAGFQLPADAEQTIDTARRSIHGSQLT
ncbi:MAG: alpha/beta hydrolase domain-containing protein, partial [Acidobacteriota bacterium]